MRRIIIAGLYCCLVFVASVQAQTVLQVPYEAAVLSWDAPVSPPPAGKGPTEWYLINCGATDVRLDAPATSIPVKSIVLAPGSYTCTIKALNTFGASLAKTFPPFNAGYIPPTADNVRIEVH